MKKRLLAIITTLAMAVAFAIPAFAAKGISTEEQKLLDKFKSGVELADHTVVTPPASYVSQAENWLIEDDLTAEQIKILSDTIDSVYKTIYDENIHSVSEIRQSSKYNSLVKQIQAACKKVGYIVEPGTASGGAIIKRINGGSSISVSPSNVKQTGFDMTATVVSVLALVGVLSAGAVVISKKDLLAD